MREETKSHPPPLWQRFVGFIFISGEVSGSSRSRVGRVSTCVCVVKRDRRQRGASLLQSGTGRGVKAFTLQSLLCYPAVL